MPESHTTYDPYFKLLLYGKSDAGKTTLAYSAVEHPDMACLTFLSADLGLKSVPLDERIYTENVNNPLPGETGDTSVVKMNNLFWRLIHREEAWAKNTKTVIIDTGTELMNQNLDTLKGDKAINSLHDQGQNTAELRKLFTFFRNAPYNIIITALVKDLFEEPPENRYLAEKDKKPPVWVGAMPLFTDKLAKSVISLFDNVWYINHSTDDKGGDVYSLLTRSRGGYFARTRDPYLAKGDKRFFDRFGVRVDSPNLTSIYETMKSLSIVGEP